MECIACHLSVGERTGLLCLGCGAILPPRPGVDRFAVFGLPRRFQLDLADLETRYRDLSRRLHPDRFARAAAAERLASLQAATTLNEAYRTLRDPVRRADYELALEGSAIGESEAADPTFLMEMMELRESLSDAQLEGDRRRVAALAADVATRRELALEGLAGALADFEERGERASLGQAKGHLVALRYYDRFLAEHEAQQEEQI